MSTTVLRTIVPAGTWSVDPSQSKVSFAVKHTGFATVRGEFQDFQGVLEVDADLSIAQARGTVRVASVNSGEPKRDDHLRSPDFFDAERYPELTFQSSRIEALIDGSFRITGHLTLHGVTDTVILQAEVEGSDIDPWGNERARLEIIGMLSRADYALRFRQALGSGNPLVADTVSLLLDISVVRSG